MADRKMKHITSDLALAVRGANVVFRIVGYGIIIMIIGIMFYAPINYLDNHNHNIILFFMDKIPFLIVGYLEYDTIRLRKKYGLSLWKGVYWQMKDIIDEELGNVPVKDSFDDSKDLNYWFDLKEKGAISEEEYEAKKKELF